MAGMLGSLSARAKAHAGRPRLRSLALCAAVLVSAWKHAAFVKPWGPGSRPSETYTKGSAPEEPSRRTSVARAGVARVAEADAGEGSAAASLVGAAAVAGGVSAVSAKAAKQRTEATSTLAVGVVGAMLFCAWVFLTMGAVPATQWLSCYVLEYSLSVDNLFVFIVIFKYFKVPPQLQTHVLNYGILGAIVFRFIFVFLGALVLQQFDFLILGFAAILIYASFMGFTKGEDDDDEDDENLDNNAIVQNLRSVLDVSPKFDGAKFFTEVDGRSMVTPLLLCLLTIELSDIVFATDSVPAVLGTTKDQFVAYSSNVFAVFGLRSLFFILQEAMVSFAYLESAVNVVLGFIGVKIVVDYFEIVHIDTIVSLAVVLGTLLGGVALSGLDGRAAGPEEGADA